jgi:hypothetical protein
MRGVSRDRRVSSWLSMTESELFAVAAGGRSLTREVNVKPYARFERPRSGLAAGG